MGQIYKVFRHMSQKKFFIVFHLLPVAQETFFQFNNAVIPGEPEDFGRDPESREVAEIKLSWIPRQFWRGMTNYDKDTTGHETEAIMEKIIGAPKNIELFLVF
jgi:hypothetical protein